MRMVNKADHVCDGRKVEEGLLVSSSCVSMAVVPVAVERWKEAGRIGELALEARKRARQRRSEGEGDEHSA